MSSFIMMTDKLFSTSSTDELDYMDSHFPWEQAVWNMSWLHVLLCHQIYFHHQNAWHNKYGKTTLLTHAIYIGNKIDATLDAKKCVNRSQEKATRYLYVISTSILKFYNLPNHQNNCYNSTIPPFLISAEQQILFRAQNNYCVLPVTHDKICIMTIGLHLEKYHIRIFDQVTTNK